MALPDRQSDEHDDPFYWGSRFVYVERDGRRQLEEIPLTRDDILEPQEGDMMVHGPRHFWVIQQLVERLAPWLKRRDMTVLADVQIVWGIPGLKNPAPDISVIPGFRGPERLPDGSYSVPEEGDLPCLLIEVISPRYQEIDTKDKVELYRRAAVQEYLIVDLMQDPVELTGYSLGRDGRYNKDRSRSRWLSKTTGLRFSAGSEPYEIQVEDPATGERLRSLEDAELLRQDAELLRQDAELRAQDAERRAQDAELRAQDAERRTASEAKARRALEEDLARLRRELDRR